MNLSLKNALRGLGFLSLSVFLTGCPPRQKPLVMEPETTPPVQEVQAPETPALEIGTEWTSVPDLKAVYFDYNRAELRPEARAGLKANAAVIKAVLSRASGVQVRVEGHCDERGTVEYNLALGQRRANAVRDYYATLGIPRTALATISYGEERPVCSQADENCWSRNRRGETALKSASPVRIPLDALPR